MEKAILLYFQRPFTYAAFIFFGFICTDCTYCHVVMFTSQIETNKHYHLCD